MASEIVTLKDAISRFGVLAKQLADVSTVAASAPEALDELEKVLQRLPAGDSFGQALEEARAKLTEVMASARLERAQSFGRIEAEFIRSVRESGKPVREQNEGWRVGMLDLQFRREQSSARVRYNHEELVGWKPVALSADFNRLEASALKLLKGAEFPPDMIVRILWNTYESERDRRTKDRKTRPELVPLIDFYRELRATIVRFELTGQKPDRRLQYTELPRWRFLYNLDRYRALGQAIPHEKRLGFQTGSQQDVQRGMGFSINGLDASQDYKTVCYVIAS